MSNNNTTSKSQRQISSGEHKLCNSQENSTGNHNSILLTIYITIHSPCYNYASCCSNHSSLKDKWSHNEQSSPMGYQVKSGGITRELDKEPSLYCSSIYINTMWSMLQQCVYLMSIHHASTSRPPYHIYVPWCHTL